MADQRRRLRRLMESYYAEPGNRLYHPRPPRVSCSEGLQAESGSESSSQLTRNEPASRSSTEEKQTSNESNVVEKTCVICFTDYRGNDLKEEFPHNCKKLQRYYCNFFCAKCLKGMFLAACRDESKMPVRCCSLIPLTCVKNVLNHAQSKLYLDKFLEWETSNRLYCPLPSCSTFIFPNLYSDRAEKESSASLLLESHLLPIPSIRGLVNINFDIQRVKNVDSVGCPACKTVICTKCSSVFHSGDCMENQFDPEIERLISKGAIRQCPKCRTGVWRDITCPKVLCRCGTRFCFLCGKVYYEDDTVFTECSRTCSSVGDAARDMIDSKADGVGSRNRSFGYHKHVWNEFKVPLLPPGSGDAECHRCALSFTPTSSKPKQRRRKSLRAKELLKSMPTGKTKTWQCYGAHIICPKCPRTRSIAKGPNPTRWECRCGIKCDICDPTKENLMEMDTSPPFWECGTCRVIICEGCKTDGSILPTRI